MKRRRISSGSVWEREFGYARAVRAGAFVAISGTVAADQKGRALSPNAYGQSLAILRLFDATLKELGGELAHVVRLRVYYTRADVSDGFTRALKETFPDGAPALTAVRVESLVSSEFLLEIEADAVLQEEREQGPWKDPGVPEWDEEAD